MWSVGEGGGGRLSSRRGITYEKYTGGILCCMCRVNAVSGLTPWIGGALLAGCAVAAPEPQRSILLVAVMLFYPLIDRQWRPPTMLSAPWHKYKWGFYAALALVCALFILRISALRLFIPTFLLTALPEEWFFRGYFMARLGMGWRANLFASLLFATLHGLTHGWITTALVFLPSLAYGWLYQRTRDLSLVVLTHAVSNLIYMLGFGAWLQALLRT